MFSLWESLTDTLLFFLGNKNREERRPVNRQGLREKAHLSRRPPWPYYLSATRFSWLSSCSSPGLPFPHPGTAYMLCSCLERTQSGGWVLGKSAHSGNHVFWNSVFINSPLSHWSNYSGLPWENPYFFRSEVLLEKQSGPMCKRNLFLESKYFPSAEISISTTSTT